MKLPRWIEAGSGDPAMVLLHGVSTRAEAWAPLLPALATPGRRVLAWDLPGYDSADHRPQAGFESWCEGLARMLDAADVARCVLVGHSLGGMIALDFAARRPDRVEALALACTTAGFGAAGGRRQREYLARRLDPLDAGRTMADIAALEIPSMMHPPADPALVARLGDLMATIPPAAYAAATRALTGFDRRAAIAELTMPVLCIAGGHDRIAPPEVLASMARRAPQGRSSMLVQTGHLAPFEAPGRFVALLDGFAMSAGEAAR
ncbi:MAG: alpha/beta fold hydrolase [Zoogloeaceae bacterium]|nr:alpha/beta fold hydrolase [Rhodocyclaceae bacterium]MCP5237751.1 alpha/beta fold hydrolase [Zoogloeaceae bacterium]